jgi:carboxyl-terminal processing protease
MIVDLRGNPGGYINTLHRCLDQFYEKRKAIGAFEGRNDRKFQFIVGGLGKHVYRGPLIVLVDEASESSAEIFAAAIMESGRGKVVGRKTGGKVLSATTKKLSENFQLLLPFQNYRTANGKFMERNGLSPDVAVALNLEKARQLRDPDIERALELLN